MDLRKLQDKRTLNRVAQILKKADERPNVEIIRKISAEKPSEQERVFQHYLSTIPKTPWESAAFKLMWMLQKGFKAMNANDMAGTIKTLRDALRSLWGGEARYFSSEFYNSHYLILFQPAESWSLHLDMVTCCIGIAQAYQIIESDIPKALEWLTEIEVLYGCLDLCFVNESESIKTIRYFESYMKVRIMMSRMFKHFGNSGTAAYHAERCRLYRTPKYITQFPIITEINKASRSEACLWSRHPDIGMADNWDVKFPSMQVRGIWNKLLLVSKFRPPGRRECPTWIWRSTLYIFGGGAENQSESGYHFIWDAWCVDLKKLDRWRRLQDVPEKYRLSSIHAKSAVVYDDYAWFFTGQRDILRFNMISESWSSVTMEMLDLNGHKWPYYRGGLMDPSIALLDHFLYVFGGDLQGEHKGSDKFVVLDLRSFEWRYLGDSSLFKHSDYPGRYWPPPRRAAGCWIVPNAKRFYLMYGTRDIKELYRRADPPRDPYHTDLWAYSIVDGKWSRESVRGNYPCPRDDMALAYNPKLDAVVMFGGRNLCMKSYSAFPKTSDPIGYMKSAERMPDIFTFFADTFIMNMSDRRWRQVVTRSFPCDRGEAHFIIDELTGEMFIYGGYGPREYINREKTEEQTFRCYNDLYRLDIEHPDSSFRMDVFLDGSMKYLKFGKWRRCYTCKKLGKGMSKCQGSCGGRYVYCSTQCQRAGWKEHRDVHGCRKI